MDSLALLGLGAVVHAGLVQGGAPDCANWGSSLLREGQSRALPLSDVAGNLVAYALLAACFVAAWAQRSPQGRPHRHALLWIILSCSAVSLGIEGLQSCLPTRLSSAWDWTLNTAGAMFGAVTGLVFIGRSHGSDDREPAAFNRGALAAVLAWAVFATSPWQLSDPALAWAKWRGLALSWALSGLHAERLITHGLQGLAIGLVIGLWPARSAGRIGLIIAMALGVPTVSLFMMRPTSLLEFWLGIGISVPAGALLATALRARGQVRLAAALALAAVLAALMWGATRAMPGRLRPFEWGLHGLEGDALEGIRLLGLSVWVALSTRLAGWRIGGRPGVWSVLALCSLALAEWLHSLTPGQPADLTGPLFGLAGVLLAHAVLPQPSSGLQSRPSSLS